MNCNDAQSLIGPFLDSELDVTTTAEFRQHLAECPECARAFAFEEKLNAQVVATLKRGQKTPELWEQVEQRIRITTRGFKECNTTASRSASGEENDTLEGRAPSRGAVAHPTGSGSVALPCRTDLHRSINAAVHKGHPKPKGWSWQDWLWPSPRVYAGLAVSWVLILVVNLLTVDRSDVNRRPIQPPPAYASHALAEQRRELAELLGLASTPAAPTKPASGPPQTQIRKTNHRLPDSAMNPLGLPVHGA